MNVKHISDYLANWLGSEDNPQPEEYIPQSKPTGNTPDIGLVRGQEDAKRALLIAAAGRHNLLMIGPPGEGKSFLASTLPGFLPPLSDYEIASLRIAYNAVGYDPPSNPPFRSIGPTISPASLLGGGRGEPIPGELPLANNGVLFIDELPQFAKPLIDSLRQPIEDRYVSVTRNGQTRIFRCDCMLIAAMNPCPCGYYGMYETRQSEHGRYDESFPLCSCPDYKRQQYQGKISGPILDRIDLVCWLGSISSQERFAAAIPNQSLLFRAKVIKSRIAQLKRQKKLNYRLGAKEVFAAENHLAFTPSALEYFKIETDKPRYSTRKTVRLARISRTIADIAGSYGIGIDHIHYAASFVDQSILSLGD